LTALGINDIILGKIFK